MTDNAGPNGDGPRPDELWPPDPELTAASAAAASTTGVTGTDTPAADAADAERTRKVKIVFFVVMALLMQLAFVVSYVGGMHSPQKPHAMRIAAVGPAQVATELQQVFDTQAPGVFKVTAKADEAAATKAIKNRDVYAAYVPSQDGNDKLLLASAAGPPAAQLLDQVFQSLTAAQQHQLAVTDVVPVKKTDIEGLVPFYLVVAWSVGGYLCSTLVGLMGGMQSRTRRLAAERIGLYAAYSVLGGFGGTLIAHTIMGFIGGDWLALALLGTMIVFSVSVFANGLQSLLGLIGTGIVIGLFVILGNPSGAGPWPREMMPAFWRVIGPLLPNFQGTNAARGIAYFASNGLTTAMLVMAAYALVGIVLSIALAGRTNPILRFSEH